MIQNVRHILRTHQLIILFSIVFFFFGVILLYKMPRLDRQVVFKSLFDEGKKAEEEQPPQKPVLNGQPVNYAVFCSSTPNGESYRSYDYAYNLPLTAMAWERIGFKSIILIIGSSCEWENDPALALILSYLEARRATVIFITSPPNYRTGLSQTARLFVVNMKEFPGKANDYIITSDSDLWPLRKEHYVPRRHMDIVLVHSQCCGLFKRKNNTYRMYPMSNIGASASTWSQIINDGHTIANDSESIQIYLEEDFGETLAKHPVINPRIGDEAWFLDQFLVSMRLSEWMEKHGNNSVYLVSDEGFSRVDRIAWDPEKLTSEAFKLKYDAHMPMKGFLPEQWRRIQPLVHLMYGKDSWQAKWCDQYNLDFLAKVRNYLNFSNPNAD